MANVRASVNQQIQLGTEVTPGTPVAASKLLVAFTWTLGLKAATKQFRGTGRQYPSASAILTEYAGGQISGPGDFAQLVYPVSSLFGPATITLVGGGPVLANSWKWTPALVGLYGANAKTYTIQVGDTVDAEQYAFSVFTGFGYMFTRKQEVQITGDLITQTFTEGIALTASPTEVEQVPMTGAQFNVYLDTSSAGIGATQLLDPLKVDYKASGYYDPYFPINRANTSYTNILDKEKKHELKLTLQANTSGIAAKASYLETGTRAYVRVSGTGPVIEVDQLVGVGAASGGTFTLTYKGQTTAGIAYNATPAAVTSALTLLSTIGANNVVTTGAAPSWTVRMAGPLTADTTAMTGSGAGLTGGAFTISTVSTNATMVHDMAVFVADMAEFSDVDGVYAVEYTLEVAEDTTWGAAPGTAQILTLTNLLTAL